MWRTEKAFRLKEFDLLERVKFFDCLRKRIPNVIIVPSRRRTLPTESCRQGRPLEPRGSDSNDKKVSDRTGSPILGWISYSLTSVLGMSLKDQQTLHWKESETSLGMFYTLLFRIDPTVISSILPLWMDWKSYLTCQSHREFHSTVKLVLPQRRDGKVSGDLVSCRERPVGTSKPLVSNTRPYILRSWSVSVWIDQDVPL